MPTVDFTCLRCSYHQQQFAYTGASFQCPRCAAVYTPAPAGAVVPAGIPAQGPSPSALDHLEQSIRLLERRTQELEQSLEPEYSTVMGDPVRFSLTNLRSKVDRLERRKEDTGERLHLVTMEYADLQKQREEVEASWDDTDVVMPADTEAVENLQNEVARLQSVLEKERQRSEAAEAEAERLGYLHVQVATYQHEIEALEARNRELNHEVQELANHLGSARDLELEARDRSDRLLRENEACVLEIQRAKDRRKFLEAQIASHEQERLAAQGLKTRIKDLQDEIERLQQSARQANQANQVLRKAAARKNRELSALTNTLTDLQEHHGEVVDQLDTTRATLAAREEEFAETDKIRDQLKRLRLLTGDLEVQNQALRIKMKEAKRTIVDAARMVGTVGDLRDRLHRLGRRYAETLEEGGRLRQENLEIRVELRDLLESIEGHYSLSPAGRSEKEPSSSEVAEAEEVIRVGLRDAPMIRDGLD